MADTFPTATTLQPRSPQKNGQSQYDGHVDNHKQKQKKVKTSHDSSKELNGIKTTTDNQLFVKSAKDKQHDRKSRSGRKGAPKKGRFHRKCGDILMLTYFVIHIATFCHIVIESKGDLATFTCLVIAQFDANFSL